MAERSIRIPSAAGRLAAILGILSILVPAIHGNALSGAEIRFAEAVLKVDETASVLTVELELDAPECAGEIRVPESVLTLSSASGGANPAIAGSDFAPVDELVPLGLTGRPPVRFGRVLQGAILDDNAFEGVDPETFLLELTVAGVEVVCTDTGATSALVAGPAAVVEIVDDDEPAVIAFSQSRDRVPESAGQRTYTLIRSGGTGGSVTAILENGSRRVTLEPSTLTWADGESGAREFTFSFPDDDEAQGNERVRVGFSLDGGVAGDPGELVVTIVDDDDSTIAFNRGTATVNENVGEATFALVKKGGGPAVSVTLAADYGGVTLEPSTLSWGAGQSGERRFTVRFDDDNRAEDDRTVIVTFDITAGNARPGSPASLTIAVEDDDFPAALDALSGEFQIATVGSAELAQPLVVLVTNSENRPIEGVNILWTVLEGDVSLVETVTTTDGEGRSSNRVRVGTTPGPVRIRADSEAAPGIPIEFAAEILPSDPVADALLRACGDNRDNLDGVCGYFFDLSTADKATVIEEIRPEEVAAQANVTQDAPRVQLGNVGARLAALRSAGTSSGVQQLSLNLQGTGLNPYAMTTALRHRTRDFDPEAAVSNALAAAVGGVELQDEEAGAPASDPGEKGKRLGFFVNGSAAFGGRPGTSLESGFDFDTLGLTAGVDYRLGKNVFVGGALGYLNTETDLDRDGGRLDSEGLSFQFYAMRFWDAGLYVQGSVGFGENDYDQARNIDLPVPFPVGGSSRFTANSTTDGTQTSFAGEIGYDASRGAWSLGGFGRLSYVDTEIDSFRETGDPAGSGFYLEIFDQSTTSLLGEGGFNWSYAASFSWGVLQPQGRFSYLYEFDDDARDVRARFIADSDPTNIFAIPTEEPDRGYFTLGFGLGAQFPRGVSAFFFFDDDFERDDFDRSTLTAGVRFEF